MYRLEYNSQQRAYHVALVSEPLIDGWLVILDNSDRKTIDQEFYKRTAKKKKR